MKLLGLENISELRVLNFLIVVWGVNSSVKKNIIENNDNEYLTNLSIAFSTSFFAILAIAFSLVFYITFINYNLIHVMENSSLWGNDLSLGHVVFIILIEGLASSIICSFIIMQYWKKHKVNSIA
tara:strand:+ start:8073 stop:8447 length:375 start_codon:yes stop_codon:yes gene_type:complete